jgi:hypothetical protein
MPIRLPPLPDLFACCGRAAITLTVAAAMPAAELVIRDLSLGLESLPTAFAYEVKDPVSRRSGNDAFTSAYGLMLGGTYSFTGPGQEYGPLAAIDLNYSTYGYPDGSMGAYGLRLGGGYGWAVNDQVQVSALVRFGAGMANLDFPTNSMFNSFSAGGIYIAYGLDLRASYVLTDHILITGEAGYLSSNFALRSSAQDVDVVLKPAGFRLGLGVSYRLSVMPWRLD